MAETFSGAIDFFTDMASNKKESLFYHFEPWDGPDEAELTKYPEKWRHEHCTTPKHTPGGAKFQKAAMKSKKRMRGLLSANRIGKTIFVCVDAVVMITGELPYSYRVEEGVDTGIKRIMPSKMKKFGRENIIRWGRRDKATGRIIDFNPDAVEDGTWDCGNITGVGKYPEERICNLDGGQVWVCCWGDHRDKTWIPMMKSMIPEHCMDVTKGTNGFSQQDNVFFLTEGKQVRFVTYDQGYKKAEAEMAWAAILDEEVTDRRFYTGIIAHCRHLLMSWTPIHGMTWSYDEIYEPAVTGKRGDIEVFHATMYDCPYIEQAFLTMLESNLKSYEYDSKVLGIYARQEGKPYFDYDITKAWISKFRPQFTPVELLAKKNSSIKEIMAAGVYKVPATPGSTMMWELYEDVTPDGVYWLAADCAKGNDDPDQAQDHSVAHVFRRPTTKESEPIHVATLMTTVPNVAFAWLCLYGAVYYNNALMCPESKGEDGAVFCVEIKDYPFWFLMPTANDRTGKVTDKIGFDTNAKNRKIAVDKMRKWVNSHIEDPRIKHLRTIIEIHEAVYKKERMDHPERGSTDGLMAFAIGLYVWEESSFQIQSNMAHRGFAKKNEFMPKIILTNSEQRDTRASSKGVLGRRAVTNPGFV